MDRIFEIATNISTPLMLAGFFAAAFFLIARVIIKANIFPKLTKKVSGEIVKVIIERLFILALTAMILGFAGYIFINVYSRRTSDDEIKEHYELPAENLIKLSLEEINAIDLLPRPDTKNLNFKFKVIPKSKDRYVPLSKRGEVIVIDSTGISKNYPFEVIADDEGIRPQVVSYIFLDGLLPRQDYEEISNRNNYRAKCIVYYDSDVVPTDLKFISETFDLNEKTIREF